MKGTGTNDMAVTHTAADVTAATSMTNAVADIEQETPEIGKERQLAGVGTGTGAGANNKKKPHDHALASILGPAFVAAVAYVDPGNVAASITSGARYGYLLVWVLVLANAMSVLIQYQSAKLGIVTNKSLPELLGERMSDAGRFMFFMQAEVIAIATDLAEVIGGAIALNLLFGLPLFIGGLVIGAISTVMLWFQGGKTQTTFERIIIVMLLIITGGLGFLTWHDIKTHKWHLHAYRLQSKLILAATMVLLLLPGLFLFFHIYNIFLSLLCRSSLQR